MAQGGQRVDIQVLHALQPKSPEVLEGVAAQCVLQNNTSDSCSKYLSQTSTDYFQGEGGLDLLDKSSLSRLRNHMTQLHLGLRTQNAGVPPSQDGSMKGSRTLPHSLSDGPLQAGQPSSKVLRQEPPLSAPVQVPTGISVFGAMDTTVSPQLPQHLELYQLGGKGHLADPDQAPRFSPITVTLAPKVQAGRKTPISLHIHGGPQPGMNSPQGNSIYIRPYVTQSGTSWYSLQQAGSPQCGSTTQQEQQQAYQVSHPPTPPSWTLSSPHSTSHTSLPQSQGHQTLHVYVPIGSSINPQAPPLLQTPSGAQPSASSFSQYNIQNISTGPWKNQIEIKLESPQRNSSSATALRSGSGPSSAPSSCPSPASFSGAVSSSASLSAGSSAQIRSQPTVYISASPPVAATTAPDELVATTSGSRSQPTFYISTSSSKDEAGRGWTSPTVYISANPPLQGSPAGVRNLSGQVSMGPAYIHHHLPRSWAFVGGRGGAIPSPRLVVNHPNTKYTFKITVSPNKPSTMISGGPPTAFEHANLCSLPADHCIEPEPHPLSDLLSMRRERPSEVRQLSVGSDDLAYTQALLLHQKARMERLGQKLGLKRHQVEKLKEEVSDVESDLTQRRLQSSGSTCKVPSMEEMQQLRCRNRVLQIDIDCLIKETDFQTQGPHLYPNAVHNVYHNSGLMGAVPLDSKGTSSADLMSKSPKTVRGMEGDEGAEWSCTACTFLNHPALLHCEQCEFPRHF